MNGDQTWYSPITALAASVQPTGSSVSSSERVYVNSPWLQSHVGAKGKPRREQSRFRDWLGAFQAFGEWLLDKVLPVSLPTSPARRGWDLWILALISYIAITVPLQIGFISWRNKYATQAVGWLASACFCLDVLVNFRTAYTTRQGDVVRSPGLIANRYLRGMFLPDLLSALPLNETLAGSRVTYNAVWLGLLKMPRLFRLVRHLNALSRTKYVNLVAVAQLLLLMLLITHWAACLWHYLAEELPEWPWMFRMKCRACADQEQYMLAFYRCFLLILGDRPDTWNNVERLFSICLLFLGAMLYAVVVSSIAMLVTNMWSMASRHKQHAAMLQDALRYHSAGINLRVKVDEYFEFMASYDHPGLEGVSLLGELPAGLHAEVLSSVFEPMLLKVPLFMYCERPFLWRLAQRLRLMLFMAHDVLYDLGSVGHNMFIIWKGSVALIGPDGCTAALLGDGDHFGELGVTTASTPRPHRAVALCACDVMLLSRWDLQDAMKDYPDSAALVKDRARLQYFEYGAAVRAAALVAQLKDPSESSPPASPGAQVAGPEALNTDRKRDSDPDAAAGAAAVAAPADPGADVGMCMATAVVELPREEEKEQQTTFTAGPRKIAYASGSGAAVVVDAAANISPVGSFHSDSVANSDDVVTLGGSSDGRNSNAHNTNGSSAAATRISAEQDGGSPTTQSPVSRWRVNIWLPKRSSAGGTSPSLPSTATAAGVVQGSELQPVGEATEPRGSDGIEAVPSRSSTQAVSASSSSATATAAAATLSDEGSQLQLQILKLAPPYTSPARQQQLLQQQQPSVATTAVITVQAEETTQVACSTIRHPSPCERWIVGALESATTASPPVALQQHQPRSFQQQQSQQSQSRQLQPEASPQGSQSTCTVNPSAGSGTATRRSLAGILGQFRLSRGGNTGAMPASIGAPTSSSPLDTIGNTSRHSNSHDRPPLRDSASLDRRRSGDVWEQITQWVEQASQLQERGVSDEQPRATAASRNQLECSTSQIRARQRSQETPMTADQPPADAAGGGTLHAPPSNDGFGNLDDYQHRREPSTAPQFLLMPPQPFLGLDPLGPFFEGASGAPQQRSRSRPGHGPQPTGGAGTGRASARSTSEGYTSHPAARHFSGPAGRRSSGRQDTTAEVSGSGMCPGSNSARTVRNSGPGMRSSVLQPECSYNERSVEGWRGEERDTKCLLLERQLALAQARLEESQAQIAAMLANPFKVPAFAAALRHEVDAATERLNMQVECVLQRLMDAVLFVTARTEELSQQVAAADGRLELLEEEHDAFAAAHDAVAGVGVGMPSTGGVLDGRDLDELNLASALALRGSRSNMAIGQLGLLHSLSLANSSGPGRSMADGSRSQAHGRQHSYTKMQHVPSRRLSAIGGNPVLPDSEPVGEVGAAAGSPNPAAGLDTALVHGLSLGDAAMVAAAMQRAKSAAWRRSGVGQVSVTSQGSVTGSTSQGAQPQPSQLPASRLQLASSQSQMQSFRQFISYASVDLDARTSPAAALDEGRPAARPASVPVIDSALLPGDSVMRVTPPSLDVSVRRGDLGFRRGDTSVRRGDGGSRRSDVNSEGSSWRGGDGSVRRGDAYADASVRRGGDVSARRGNRRASALQSFVTAGPRAASAVTVGGSSAVAGGSNSSDGQQPPPQQAPPQQLPQQQQQIWAVDGMEKAAQEAAFREITVEEVQPWSPPRREDDGASAAVLRHQISGNSAIAHTGSCSLGGGLGRTGAGGGGEWAPAARRIRNRREGTQPEQQLDQAQQQQHPAQGLATLSQVEVVSALGRLLR